MKTTDPPIIVEETYASTVSAVWEALTNHQQMIQWYFDNLIGFEPVVGFETEFAVSVDDRTFTHQWKVTEVVPEKKIVTNWKYKEYPGDSFVTFEIFDAGEQVRLRLSTDVVEDFPTDIPEFKRESGEAGWNYFLIERLKPFLEG